MINWPYATSWLKNQNSGNVKFWLLHSHPFMNCHYHFIIVALATLTAIITSLLWHWQPELPLSLHYCGTGNLNCHYHFIIVALATWTAIITSLLWHWQPELPLSLHYCGTGNLNCHYHFIIVALATWTAIIISLLWQWQLPKFCFSDPNNRMDGLELQCETAATTVTSNMHCVGCIVMLTNRTPSPSMCLARWSNIGGMLISQ